MRPPRLAAGLAAVILAGAGALAGPASPALADEACTPGKTQWIAQSPRIVADLGMAEAWRLSDGAVTVAVVDSGVDARNAHLAGAVLPGKDFVTGGDGRTDASGHGTAVAGLIAARQVPGSGLIGLAPAARILPVRTYVTDSADDQRAGLGPSAKRTAAGIRWAADNGAAIIVVPLSTNTDVPALRAAVLAATAKGSLVVASAGNVDDADNAATVQFPAGYAPALSVTAVDAQGRPSDAVRHGAHVEVAAPGSAVLTAFRRWGDCVMAPERPSTSYAAGYVGAVAALVASAYPEEKPADWEFRILTTALRPNRAGRDPLIGWGIVAPYPALNFVNDGRTQGPPNPRFPEQPRQVPPVLPQPAPQDDPVPALRQTILGVAGAVGALLVGGLLLVRLRRPGRG